MTIKPLDKKDAKLISEVLSKSFSDGWTESMISSGFDGGLLRALGAFDDDVLGVITYSVGLDTADIEDVAVVPTERRKGVAKTLIEHVIADLKDKRILLEVRESNIGAIKLYEKTGFRKISVRKKYYADGENAVVMEKE